MHKLLRTLIILVSGVILGLLIFNLLNTDQQAVFNNSDTSVVTNAFAVQHETISQTRRNAITTSVEIVNPAVVSVNVTKVKQYIQRSPYSTDPYLRQFFPEFFGERIIERPVQFVGSGFIISADGYIVTNEHVISNADEIVVAMGDGNEYKAELVGKDHMADIALIKIDLENLSFVTLGNSDDLLIGEWAIALGNPFGLFTKNEPTVTVGVISAINRNFSPLEGRVYEDMIQTDAAINSGNSGGPLCNAVGQVIGMNTFIYSSDPKNSGSVGIGFAIPSNHIKLAIERLKKKGTGDKDIWIGMYVSNLNPYLGHLLGYPQSRGVYIKRIDKGSPAEVSGIQLGDIITAINNTKVFSLNEAQDIIDAADPRVGDKLIVNVWRKNTELQASLLLTKYPN